MWKLLHCIFSSLNGGVNSQKSGCNAINGQEQQQFDLQFTQHFVLTDSSSVAQGIQHDDLLNTWLSTVSLVINIDCFSTKN